MTKIRRNRLERKRYRGFSLIELMVVVAIILIVAAMAIPSIRRTISTYQLNVSGRVVAARLQDARMLAVKTNQPYYANFTVGRPPNFLQAAPASRPYNQSIDPTGETSGAVTFQNPAGVNFAQFTAFLGGAAPQVNVNPIGFNSRGLPCNPGVNAFVCTPVGAGGFAWFMQDPVVGWEAVTVSPTGRIRSWRQVSPGVWQ